MTAFAGFTFPGYLHHGYRSGYISTLLSLQFICAGISNEPGFKLQIISGTTYTGVYHGRVVQLAEHRTVVVLIDDSEMNGGVSLQRRRTFPLCRGPDLERELGL